MFAQNTVKLFVDVLTTDVTGFFRKRDVNVDSLILFLLDPRLFPAALATLAPLWGSELPNFA